MRGRVSKDRIIYGNCQVLSPDGILMFICEEKRINWYLIRNLAEKTSDNPPTIKLKFTPNGLGNHNKGYGLNLMRNICVNCGTNKYLTRHHVVPYCYRQHFPDDYKSHNFHDVLPVCKDCHNKYERIADAKKLEIAEKYNAPIQGISNPNYKDACKFSKLASLLLYNDKIPNDRRLNLENEVKRYLNKDIISENDLKELINYNEPFLIKTHGQLVMEQVDNIDDFIKSWREHFISNNECNFLPQNWSINNQMKNNE